MEIYATFVFAAIIIEFVVGVLTSKLPEVVLQYVNANVLSLLLGVGVAFAFCLDMFATLGMTTAWVWLAYLLTGILLAGGSKLWHELIAKLRESRSGSTDPEPIYYTNTITNIPPEGE